jgi:hypothetical protein
MNSRGLLIRSFHGWRTEPDLALCTESRDCPSVAQAGSVTRDKSKIAATARMIY